MPQPELNQIGYFDNLLTTLKLVDSTAQDTLDRALDAETDDKVCIFITDSESVTYRPLNRILVSKSED